MGLQATPPVHSHCGNDDIVFQQFRSSLDLHGQVEATDFLGLRRCPMSSKEPSGLIVHAQSSYYITPYFNRLALCPGHLAFLSPRYFQTLTLQHYHLVNLCSTSKTFQ